MPVQQLTSLIPLESKRQVLAVHAIGYQHLSVCGCQQSLRCEAKDESEPSWATRYSVCIRLRITYVVFY